MIYQIDLNRNEISTNEQNEKYSLRKKLLDKHQRRQSSMMFNQIDLSENSFSTLKCFHRFHQTMSNSLWTIERVISSSSSSFSLSSNILFVEDRRNRKSSFRFVLFVKRFWSRWILFSRNFVLFGSIHYSLWFSFDQCQWFCFDFESFRWICFVDLDDPLAKDSICLTSDAWTSHLNGSKRSTDAKFSLIVAQISSTLGKHDRILLSNDQNHLIRPKYILFYRFQCQYNSNWLHFWQFQNKVLGNHRKRRVFIETVTMITNKTFFSPIYLEIQSWNDRC